MNLCKNKTKRSFTLIELLVVIAIIGLLSSVVLVALNEARIRARDAKRLMEISQIRTALELYYSDYNQYPASGVGTPPVGWSKSYEASWDVLKTALEPYINLPKDPINETANYAMYGYLNYAYYSLGYGCDRQWYMLVYNLERPGHYPTSSVTSCDGHVWYTWPYMDPPPFTVGSCQACH